MCLEEGQTFGGLDEMLGFDDHSPYHTVVLWNREQVEQRMQRENEIGIFTSPVSRRDILLMQQNGPRLSLAATWSGISERGRKEGRGDREGPIQGRRRMSK